MASISGNEETLHSFDLRSGGLAKGAGAIRMGGFPRQLSKRAQGTVLSIERTCPGGTPGPTDRLQGPMDRVCSCVLQRPGCTGFIGPILDLLHPLVLISTALSDLQT